MARDGADLVRAEVFAVVEVAFTGPDCKATHAPARDLPLQVTFRHDHWGGAFVRPAPGERPHYWYDDPAPKLNERGKKGARTVNKWRRDYLRDWQVRMDRAAGPKGR